MNTLTAPTSSRPRIVGLTGGIGSGKTTVLQLFSALGVPCLQADRQAALYYRQDDFLLDIRRLFGDSVFNGSVVDKRAIASIVFNDPHMLARLNALIHPRVARDLHRWCRLQHAPYVIFESAILYESGLHTDVDAVVAVYLDKAERLRRLQLRDHTSPHELEARMRNQLSPEELLDRADYVILNYEGNPRQRQVTTIHNRLLLL